MATSLVDSPPDQQGEQATPDPSGGAPGEPGRGPAAPAGAERGCAGCAAAMAAGQDWCLQCGAGAPGSLDTPSRRSAVAVFGAVAILALGAAVAGYAALHRGAHRPRVVITTVARAPASTTTVPAPSATTTTTPAVVPGAAPKGQATLPLSPIKPPKIPLTAATPTSTGTGTTTTGAQAPSRSTATTPTSTAPGSSSTGSSGATSEETQPAAILLDTDAASTYNPYNLPASEFGDPSLAIDGDPATAWTAQVSPATAPTMAEGLLIDLKSKQRLSALKLITSTPGMSVQVYGANGHTVPPSITDPAWIALSHFEVVKKKHLRFTLRDSKKTFTFVTLWISKAPAASVGTPAAPGHVVVNEVELFPVR